MFQDEAGFGRINKPKYCWCKKGIRPSVPCHHIREYMYAYGAAWHKSNGLELPNNIRIVFIPPYTPEMNPIEQIWKEIRKRGFKNEVFQTLDNVVDRLCDTINSLTADIIKSITGRKWILSTF